MRANWHIEDLDLPPVQPEDLEAEPEIHELAERIDLRDVAEMRKTLGQLQAAEARMAADGLTCKIRAAPGTTCSACPVARRLGDGDLSSLCENGKLQERLETSIIIHGQGDPTA